MLTEREYQVASHASLVQKETRPSALKLRTTCDACRAKKVKCDSLKPSCGSCQKKGIICKYSNKGKRGRPKILWDNQMQITAVLNGMDKESASYLDTFCRLFGNSIPSFSSSFYAACLGKLSGKVNLSKIDEGALVELPPEDQAAAGSLMSAIAAGAMMAGNRRDLPQLVQQVERLTSRPAAKVGAAGMRVLHHLGLLYGLMDNQPAQHRVVEEARSRRDEVPPAVHAGTKAIAMMASGCQVVGSMVVEGDFTFTDEELESLDGPARAYYRAKGEILLSPQLCGGKEASPEWDAQRDGGRIHSILQSALEEVGRVSGKGRLTTQSLNLMFALVLVELTVLGRVQEGCKRGVEILEKLSDEIGRFTNVMVMESLWHNMDAMGYVFWLLGSEEHYKRTRLLRNSLLPYKPEAQAFPAYQELTAAWWQGCCPSFMCNMLLAKFHDGLLAHAPEMVRPDHACSAPTTPPELELDDVLGDLLGMAAEELDGKLAAAQQPGWDAAALWSVSGQAEKASAGVFPPAGGPWNGVGGGWATQGDEAGEQWLQLLPDLS
mmetsp:Transcript_34015/g.61893  ORF Transcript_34015/g.61893 Transcript_34015/m.61893 type:complete len:549 (+) Transcript_34015:150-1796(+)